MSLEPLKRLDDEQLEAALDEALVRGDLRYVWKIIEEIERRGGVLKV